MPQPSVFGGGDAQAQGAEASGQIHLSGSCFCRGLVYQLRLDSKDEARTSLCHCGSCKKAFGGAFGLTTKVPLHGFRYTNGKPTIYAADNGLGTAAYREFCNKCGSCICEYSEQTKTLYRYIALGSLDEPSALPPKGEFFCSQREDWMSEIPGELAQFVKQ
ncbi:hypothetical protein BS50DRAFT_635517 [Corynespora cassiicola Philippines]|uniref:CENP-V/GFA domain-containing protein n=1 Tax=Corynespora cassiicola Philippines TaxID=1448308 RepID=A0A2T2NMV8_CORCC|nr:hypothetical protein BS50DRAFT_635517 [Corynespora cassiicola Philippines]